jgi:enoyl-CoA hydratase/carnithine racemase
MEDKPLRLHVESGIARITLARPDRHNALDAGAITLFRELLERVAGDPGARVLLLTGEGERTFCSGAALGELERGELSGETFDALATQLAALELPSVCALNGSVYGGGAEIALACDYRIGVEGMRLLVPAARIGLCYPPAGIGRYVAKLGADAAMRILMGAEEFDAEGLRTLGYLHRVVAAERLAAEAGALAAHLAALAPLAVRAMKRLVGDAARGRTDAAMAARLAGTCAASADLREGLAARREKRAPRFGGS